MKVKTFDGNAINDGTNYASFLMLETYGLPDVTPMMAGRTGTWPVVSGIRRGARQLFLDIEIKGALSTYEVLLTQYFDPEDETPKKLVIEDEAGGNDRYVYAICERLTAENRFHYVATLMIDGDIRWREDTAATDTWNITATGQTKNITNNGKMNGKWGQVSS